MTKPLPDSLLVIVESRRHDDGLLRIAVAEGADGTMFVPAFTSEDAVLRFRGAGAEVASAPLSALRDFLVLADAELLVIDPGDASPEVAPRIRLK